MIMWVMCDTAAMQELLPTVVSRLRKGSERVHGKVDRLVEVTNPFASVDRLRGSALYEMVISLSSL
jgi:heme oxygenase